MENNNEIRWETYNIKQMIIFAELLVVKYQYLT